MKLKRYTVVGLCECGCDNSFVEHVQAENPEGAEKAAMENPHSEDGERRRRLIAIFPGHLQDVCEHVFHSEG